MIGQHLECDKLENWAKLIIGKNWKIGKEKKLFFGHFDLEAESIGKEKANLDFVKASVAS